MFSKFFIDCPIFATVVSILFVLGGLVSLFGLPVEQYPEITPPTVVVRASYPGASAQTIADMVASPIEQEVNGVEGMLYMSSTSSSTGDYSLTVTFDLGTNLDMANIFVENRVNAVLRTLPEEVQELGVTTSKESSNVVVFIALTSDNPIYDALYLSNYAALNIENNLARLEGVGNVSLFGAGEYSMRIWLDPDQLAIRGITPEDIIEAIEAQNILVAGGSVGASPLGTPVAYEYSIRTQGLLVNEEEFENIIIRKEPDGGYLRVKDVAKVLLGRESYATDALFNNKHVAALGIYQLPGSNAIDVLNRVEAEMQKLEKYFPEGISYHIPLDTTEFIHASVAGIYNTLITAFILVLVVILLFLQNWRAMLIPLATIPVSLIGTFIFMQAMGFSLNTLTLFGLVLAIGLVVDDAIIVVENSYRLLETGKYPTVRAAVTQAMQEISGAIVGIVLVLTAIFVPTAFIGGITGELYRQFALTLAVATIISGFNALTLSPALCALFLKPREKEITKGFFGLINRSLNYLKGGYSNITRWFVHHSKVSFGIFVLLLIIAFFSFSRLPRTFIPTEDQGYFIAFTQLTDGASQAQTAVVMDKISEILSKEKGIKNYITINGMSMMTGAESSNAGTVFAVLTNWDERTADSLSAEAIVKRFNAAAYEMIPEAETFAILPPAIPGLGESSGFEVMIQDINNYGALELQKVADEIMYGAAKTPGLSAVETMFSAETPEFYLNIDRDKVEMMQLSLNDVFTTLTTFLGSDYVNKFVKFGRTYEVNLEGNPESRSLISDLRRINVRNANGKMIPFTSFTTIENKTGANALTRYNTYLSALVQGSAAEGYSSGEGIQIMENLINKTVGTTFGYEWTSMAYQEVNASSSTVMIFVFAILAAFLILAAQYESWSSPAAVLMVIPIAILGVTAGAWITGLPVSVYTQIGMILLIGLAAKNAILIVSFARDFHAAGNATERAAIEGGDIRFRPILMTSLAVIFGTFPLVVATGAGASGRVSLGTALFSGMIMATIVGTLLIPAFYTIMQNVQDRFNKKSK